MMGGSTEYAEELDIVYEREKEVKDNSRFLVGELRMWTCHLYWFEGDWIKQIENGEDKLINFGYM